MKVKRENKKVKERSRERKEEKKKKRKKKRIVKGIEAYNLGSKKMKTYLEEQSCLKQSCCVHWLINGNYGNTVGAVSLFGPRHAP